MIALHDFNHLPHEKALALIHPCVALPEWADALALRRPYASRDELFSTANALTHEALFGRVFLIRAKGRSGEEILQALHARLENSDAQEVRAALEQLREITLLRLEGVISE